MQNDQRTNASDQLQILEVTQPSSGTVEIDGDQIVLSTGETTSSITFTYIVTDGSTSSEATATVVVLSDSGTSRIDDIELDLALTDPGNDSETSGPLPTLQVPDALLAILSLDLREVSLMWLIGAMTIPLFLLFRIRSTSGWATIEGVDRGDTVPVQLRSGELRLRHDAQNIWVTGRKRRGLVQVETFAGTGWMKPDHLHRQTW